MIHKLLAICILGTAKLKGNDDALFLQAIAQVESNGDVTAHNPRCHGRGIYQIGPACWAQHSSRPHSDAHDPTIAFIVAMRHLAWLRKDSWATGYPQLAAMWRFGRTGWMKADEGVRQDYVERVMAIFNELKTKHVVR
jgi:soluble lytic murein transglycosylase-like protein